MKRVSLLFVLLATVAFGTLTACQQTDTTPEVETETPAETETETTPETAPSPEPEATTSPQSSIETPENQAVENSSDTDFSATPVVSPVGEGSEVSQPVLLEEEVLIEDNASEMSEVESGVEPESYSTEEMEPTVEEPAQ